MSFRPPRFFNLGVGRPRLGPRGQTNELSQLSSTNSRFSTSTSASRLLSHHAAPRPRSHQYQHHYHQKQHSHHHSNRSWNQQTRHNSTNSNPNGPNPSQKPNPNQQARIDRLISRLPRFLHPYLSSLRSSPSSFVVAFLILHEITAVVPGLGFFYFFHYYDTDSDQESGDGEGGKEGKGTFGRRFEGWVMGWMMEHGYSEVMTKKMEGFERWFRRKGYFGFGKEGEEGREEGLSAVTEGGDLAVVGKDGKKSEGVGAGGGEGQEEEERKEQVLMRKWQSGDEKYRVLVDAALAYAITKVLLPVRIIVSVQATPWFAGVLGRVRRAFGGGLRK